MHSNQLGKNASSKPFLFQYIIIWNSLFVHLTSFNVLQIAIFWAGNMHIYSESGMQEI